MSGWQPIETEHEALRLEGLREIVRAAGWFLGDVADSLPWGRRPESAGITFALSKVLAYFDGLAPSEAAGPSDRTGVDAAPGIPQTLTAQGFDGGAEIPPLGVPAIPDELRGLGKLLHQAFEETLDPDARAWGADTSWSDFTEGEQGRFQAAAERFRSLSAPDGGGV